MAVLRASGKVGDGAANKVKGAACRAVAIACGAVGFVAGAAYVVYRRGRAFIADLFSPATPIARRHETHRAEGQKTEWKAMRRRSNMEYLRLTRTM